MKIEKLPELTAFYCDDTKALWGKVQELIDAHNESQEPKALEEKPETQESEEMCCIDKLVCLCPDGNGVSEHNSYKCPCPEHYATHSEWIGVLIANFKPQDEPKECCENGNLNQEHQCLKQPCHQESETEVKECPYGCSHHKVLGDCGKCPNPCSGDYIILPRPKGMRIGQSIENFLRFAKKVGLLEDAFYYRDEEVLEMWSDFLKSLEK